MKIELRRAAMTYQAPDGEVAALQDVTFGVADGEFVSIVGPSGCGKSTLLALIAGIEHPSGGEVLVDGEPVRAPTGKAGLMPQRDQLFDWRTIWGNVTLGLEVRHENTPEHRGGVHDLLEQYQLAGFARKLPNQLSGGMRQRCALIRTLATSPDVLLLDEPFSALDTYLRERLQAEMRELLKSYGGPVLLVTHSRDEAYRLCRSIAVMDQGSATPPRPTKELFEDPHTVAAANLTGCKNISRAEKRGEHQLYAVDWGVTLSTAAVLHDGLCAVGVRAHDILEEERHNRYAIVCGQPIEDPFELTQPFTFACQGDKKMLLWVKLQRREDYTPPKEVGIAPDKVLPLYEK